MPYMDRGSTTPGDVPVYEDPITARIQVDNTTIPKETEQESQRQFDMVRVIQVNDDAPTPHMIMQPVEPMGINPETMINVDEEQLCFPWPGQQMSDYKDKDQIVMLAILVRDVWFVLMTGDRVYADFPTTFCDGCT